MRSGSVVAFSRLQIAYRLRTLSKMRITGITAVGVSIPRQSVLTTSYGGRSEFTSVIVQVETDEGLAGVGQVATENPFYGETAAGVLANVRAYLAPALVGERPFDIERLSKRMQSILPNHWSSHAGIDLALWDLKGKALGVPVYELLGGRTRDGISLMGFVRRGSPSKMADDAASILTKMPFPILKMKVGIDVADDIICYQAVAEAIGDRAVLQVDGNAGYTLAEAIPALTSMQRIGRLGAIEQPVARLDDLADIARRIPVPVIADEAVHPPRDALDIVRSQAASVALIKLTKHGGILNVQKIAAILEAGGLSLSVAISGDVIAAAAAHLAAALPCVRWPSPFPDLVDSILTRPLLPDGLLLRVPDGPGFGVTLDLDKVRKYEVHL